jgi:hypothetical protein
MLASKSTDLSAIVCLEVITQHVFGRLRRHLRGGQLILLARKCRRFQSRNQCWRLSVRLCQLGAHYYMRKKVRFVTSERPPCGPRGCPSKKCRRGGLFTMKAFERSRFEKTRSFETCLCLTAISPRPARCFYTLRRDHLSQVASHNRPRGRFPCVIISEM